MSERTSRAVPLASVGQQIWTLPSRFLDTWMVVADRWSERARQRQQLRELSDFTLKDLGLSRSDVVRESAKWFWQR